MGRPAALALAAALVVPLSAPVPDGPPTASPRPVAAAAPGSWQVTSPSGVVTATVTRDPVEGRLDLTVSRSGEQVLTSPLGLTTDGADLSRDLRVDGVERTQTNERYDTVVGKRRHHEDTARQLTLRLSTPAGARLDVQVRAFDDGVGYRYHLPGEGEVTVTGERSGFTVPAAATGWLMEYRGNYENQYEPLAMTDVEPVDYAFPALLRVPGRSWALLTESDVDGRYAASRLRPTRAPGSFRVVLPESSVTSGRPLATPWRVAVVGSLDTVVGTDLVTDLAPDSRLADTSWVQPGTVAWSWWSDGGSPRSLARQQDYVDHAAEEGWGYVLVDEGWNPAWMPELVAYARERGVGVVVWARWDDLETQAERDRLLPLWRSWGVSGVKLDFMNADSQSRMRWYDDVLRDTAAHRLMVNFHGSTVPRGLERTWPHVLTTEGVRGAEDYHLGWVTPRHNVALAFTRNVVGSMDYTPVTLSADRRETSAGHELGLAVVYESGWQHPADSVESYDSRGVAEAVLRVLPTTWDETRLVSGAPGSAVTLARRSGQRWFVGSAQAGAGRTTSVPLGFLAAGERYVAEVVRDDGHDDLEVTRRTVTGADTLRVPSAADGGFVVLLCPAGQGGCLDDRLLTTVRVQAARDWPGAGTGDAVAVEVENDTTAAVRDVGAGLDAPPGWTVRRTGPATAESVAAGETATFTWDVDVPADAAPGSRHEIRSEVTYTAGGRTVRRTGVRSLVVAPGAAPSGSPYLSDMEPYDSFNWVGPLERDRSNGGPEAGDGSTLTIEGRSFAKGLGGHAHSEQVYHLGRACDRLTGQVGVDDAVGPSGSVAFHVWGDGRQLFDSGPMSGRDAARPLDADLDGVEALRLVLVDGGDFVGDDHGDWADARLSC